MLDKPVVFLSSTISSLRDLRDALTAELEKLGYAPNITTKTPLPDPSASVRATCLNAVDVCDILVLIIDKDYGTEIEGKWLVKEEFHHAQRAGKPSYICVRTSVWAMYEAWKQAGRKPTAIAKRYGVHANVLRFIDEISVSSEHWIIQFDQAQELADRLRESLAAYFAQLLRTKASASIVRVGHLVAMMNDSYRQGKYVQALLACENILRVDKSNIEALLSRAICKIRLHGLTDQRALEDGIRDCQFVLEIEPGNYRARYNMANFKLLTSGHTVQEVQQELDDLFREFPEYKYYFDQDKEFRMLLDLRRVWSNGFDPSK